MLSHRPSDLPEPRVGEQAGARADAAVAAPDRNRHAGVIEGLLPGDDMLGDTVDERATQVEHAGVLAPHGTRLGISGPVTGRWPAAWEALGLVTDLTPTALIDMPISRSRSTGTWLRSSTMTTTSAA
jgi:hypothetical protein